MAKNLVIVESPAKAKTIEGFLGKDFLVKSSFGHVRDLVKKGMAVDTDNKFQPKYEISPDKHAILGPTPGVPNLYLINGSSGHGVMHAPALGQLLAEIVCDGRASTRRPRCRSRASRRGSARWRAGGCRP